eukprot:1720626-Rhodomonas_salina.2
MHAPHSLITTLPALTTSTVYNSYSCRHTSLYTSVLGPGHLVRAYIDNIHSFTLGTVRVYSDLQGRFQRAHWLDVGHLLLPWVPVWRHWPRAPLNLRAFAGLRAPGRSDRVHFREGGGAGAERAGGAGLEAGQGGGGEGGLGAAEGEQALALLLLRVVHQPRLERVRHAPARLAAREVALVVRLLLKQLDPAALLLPAPPQLVQRLPGPKIPRDVVEVQVDAEVRIELRVLRVLGRLVDL